jgi:hypothetical protein
MDIEPRHLFFFVFLAVTLMLVSGIADGVIHKEGGVTDDLLGGSLSERLTAIWTMLSASFDWLPLWIQWPFRIINIITGFLIMRAIWKLVPIVGR